MARFPPGALLRDDPRARARHDALAKGCALPSNDGDGTLRATRVQLMVSRLLDGALSTSDVRRLAQEWDISLQEASELQGNALGIVRQMQGNPDEVRTRLSSWLDAIARQAGERKDVRGAAAAAKVFADVTGLNAPKEVNVTIDISDSSAVRARLKAAVAAHREVYRELLLEVYAESGEAMVLLPAPIQTTTSYPQPLEQWRYPDEVSEGPSRVIDGHRDGPQLVDSSGELGERPRGADELGAKRGGDESTPDATSWSRAELHSLDVAHALPTPHEVAKLPWDE